LADSLDFGAVQTTRNTWPPEKVVSYLPDAAKQRFPKDTEALKASVYSRIQALG
jgi:hypothetical protein